MPVSLLTETDIHPQEISWQHWGEWPCFYVTAPGSVIPFDLPAAAFYLLSRYEEYLPFTPDRFGRFPATASCLYRQSCLQTALVDRWALKLSGLLRQRYPDMALTAPVFRYRMTLDIDNAYAYRYKGWWRTAALYARELFKGRFVQLAQRMRVAQSRVSDPYDTYEWLQLQQQQYGFSATYFFLLGDYGPYDRNISHRQPALRKLISSVSQYAEVGIHPSFASDSKEERIKKETARLAAILGKPVHYSRQHYLRLRFPDTYRALIAAGITDDYTLGYADQPGFRAGTCHPFRFFDLLQNELTGLTLHPLTVMDGTLCEYLQLDVPQAVACSEALIAEVRATGGTFIALWHNETLTDQGKWKGWRQVWQHQIECAQR